MSKVEATSKASRSSANPAARSDATLLNLLTNVRTGQLTTGPLEANRWLTYTARDKTEQERKIERAMESCTFKAVMSFVVGEYWSFIM